MDAVDGDPKVSPEGRLLWITPEKSGGIRSYAEALWPAIRSWCEAEGGIIPLEPRFSDSLSGIAKLKPSLIHVQHEFGLFGSKVPGFYRFPGWLRELREIAPGAKIVATAHSVLDDQYRYPWKGRGWQAPFRVAANLLILRLARRRWIEGTWGRLDGVVVHSELQKPVPVEGGCPEVRVIPHYVPSVSSLSRSEGDEVIVFGYFSQEKGQDIAIEAWGMLGSAAPRLILAGGVRRAEDQAYQDRCRERIRALRLEDRVEITGFVAPDQVDAIYARASVVLAPFRETSGSGSLAQALARGKAILASDLPLNREIDLRQPGALAYFRSEDPADCADRVRSLLESREAREVLKAAARKYAEAHSVAATAEAHVRFYREIFKGGLR